MSLTWIPKRRGHIYCSSACGDDCKWTDYQAAIRLAKELAEKCGPGFKPVVHENMGWHFRAVSADGKFTVYHDSRFSAWLTGEAGQWIEYARTPQGAIRKAVASAKKDLKRLADFLEGF